MHTKQIMNHKKNMGIEETKCPSLKTCQKYQLMILRIQGTLCNLMIGNLAAHWKTDEH